MVTHATAKKRFCEQCSRDVPRAALYFCANSECSLQAEASDWSAGDVDADGEPLVTITKAEYERLKSATPAPAEQPKAEPVGHVTLRGLTKSQRAVEWVNDWPEVGAALYTAPPAAAVPDENAERAHAAQRLIYGFMLDCNAIGLQGAAENLHRGIKERAAMLAAAPEPST